MIQRLLALCLVLSVADNLLAQKNDPSRREYFTPGLILESEGRNAACDVLTFTRDGQHLLAAGDDKIVRNWLFTNKGLEASPLPTLRWRIFREVRGNIYALALSPDREQKQVAIAGHGLTGAGFAAAVLDRETGDVVHGLDPKGKEQQGTVWSIDFSPSGKKVALGTQYGVVWVWDLTSGQVQKVGDYQAKGEEITSFAKTIRLVAFTDESNVVSVAGNGQMAIWNLQGQAPKALHQFSGSVMAPVSFSGDRRWLAVATFGDKKGANKVEVVSFPGAAQTRSFSFPPGQLPQRVALNSDGSRLAVSIRRVDENAAFLIEQSGAVKFYDVQKQTPLNVRDVPQSLYAEGLAFHPRHKDIIAVAGGDNHEVAVWDYQDGRRIGKVVRSAGSCLWSVSLSPDTRYVAFQEGRDPRAPSPNDRGTGAHRFFDLQNRKFVDKAPFQPAPPLTSAGGWKVVTSLPNVKKSETWFVQKGVNPPIPLPWNHLEDEFPRCYAFLPALRGHPDRVAIGHYWGVSIFELTDKGPRRVRLFKGHEGYVTSIAISADQRKMITASRDQTLAGWSLDDWPSHSVLGASIIPRGGSLFVEKIDAGSPFWEVGLSPNDEIKLLVVGGKNIVYNRLAKYGKQVGAVQDVIEALRHPRPGKEHYLGWTTPGKGDFEQLTTVIDRPLWRLFPTRDKEWVMWRWRDYFYDTSTNGDFHIGWQRSFDIHKTPVFYRAEQFRKVFLRPDKLAEAVSTWKGGQALVKLNTFEPPAVDVAVSSKEASQGVNLTVTVKPQGTLDNHQPSSVQVWINDYRYAVVDAKNLRQENGAYTYSVALPAARFRSGANLVTAQCYSVGQARGEATPVIVSLNQKPTAPRIFGLIIGVGDYSKSVPFKPSKDKEYSWPQLNANEDAEVVHRLWSSQKAMYPGGVNVQLLKDFQVNPTSVANALDALAKQIKPDDLLVFHMGGHGIRLSDMHKIGIPKTLTQGLGQFLYVCGNYDVRNLLNSTISIEYVSERLVKLPCQKVILIDACHSGTARDTADAPSNPIRILTKDGIGPIIIAACTPEQEAQEVPNKIASVRVGGGGAYGFFTIAMRKVFEDSDAFKLSDGNKNGVLEAKELYQGVQTQIREIISILRPIAEGLGDQDAVAFVPRLLAQHPLAKQ